MSTSADRTLISAAEDGAGETLVAGFGFPKAITSITVEAQPGTFPADATPDLNGIQLTVTDLDTEESNPCTLFAAEPGTAGCSLILPTDDTMQVTFPADQVPDGFLLPAAATFSTSDCVELFCDGPTIQLPGTWQTVGLTVTNAVTGTPVEGAEYTLCEPATTTSGDCPSGTAPADSATSDASGNVAFEGLYQGSPDFQVVATSVPAPYFSPEPQVLDVPVIDELTEVGEPFVGEVTLAPKPPVVQDDTATLPQNSSQQVDVLANDSTPAGALTLEAVDQPAHGKAELGPDGGVVYTPTTGFVGSDTFDYTVSNEYGGTAQGTVSVTVTDIAPTLGSVQLRTDEGQPVSFDALDEASAPEGNIVHVSSVGTPAHGTAVVHDGVVTYTPDDGFSGEDSFSYSVADQHGGTATAQVTVTVVKAPATTTPPDEQTPNQAAPQQPTDSTTATLGDTGAPMGPGTIGIGGLLVALGGLLVGWSRRRRPSHSGA
jgi:hypothetical protein